MTTFELNQYENNDRLLDHSFPYAIQGEGLYKYYKSGFLNFSKSDHLALDGLNINIKKAQIYGLLGPSGCGKTTLLKCLLGLLHIDDGKIVIDDKLRSRTNRSRINLSKLGFMPQETCLFSELTVSETFFYFGKLCSMPNNEIEERQDFLLKLLDLTNKNSCISNLSGGQARRTSFAVSLLNHPKILILDEPTVGMDPILRKKIWDYLVLLTERNRTTVLITTHYIEEARRANCVGFMRKGRIIEENKPELLMQKYNHNILEEVFYSICSNTQANGDSDESKEHLMNGTVGFSSPISIV